MSGETVGPTVLDIDQQEHATLIAGEADHGRIRFAIEIENSRGLVEEHEIAQVFGDAIEEVSADVE